MGSQMYEMSKDYLQTLFLSRKWMRERLDVLCLVSVYFRVERSCDFVDVQSDLLNKITALFNLVNLYKTKINPTVITLV